MIDTLKRCDKLPLTDTECSCVYVPYQTALSNANKNIDYNNRMITYCIQMKKYDKNMTNISQIYDKHMIFIWIFDP